MARYDVFGVAVNPRTGELMGQPRIERIDTDENEIFRDCSGPWEVEDRYHAYWNRLQDDWEHNFPASKEKVLVLSVTPAP